MVFFHYFHSLEAVLPERLDISLSEFSFIFSKYLCIHIYSYETCIIKLNIQFINFLHKTAYFLKLTYIFQVTLPLNEEVNKIASTIEKKIQI